MQFRLATRSDAQAIADLVNIAYRGETSRAGWTTEADLLEGLRTTVAQVQQLLIAPNTFILLCIEHGELIGSICLDYVDSIVHVGMFVVKPNLQNAGIGKALLTTAEKIAQQTWPVKTFVMQVISIRETLIAFYERRGYQRTGQLSEFPVNPALWQPKQSDLMLIELVKRVE